MENINLDKTKLGYLGEEFQYKIVKGFMEDEDFLFSIYSAVDQNMFTAPKLNIFVGTLKDYVDRYEMVPSYNTMSIELRQRAFTEIDIQEYESIINRVKATTYDGIESAKDIAIKFFRQQKMLKVANTIQKTIGEGNGTLDNYEQCLELFESAINVGKVDDEAVSPFDLIDDALSPSYHVTIPTGIKRLDAIMKGGIDKGKLGVIIGSAGFGKTSMTTAFAAAASTYKCEDNNNEGFKVLQIFFEDDLVDVTRKHFSRITQIESRDLVDSQERIDEVRNILENWPNRDMMKRNLRIKRYDTGETTVSQIMNYIKRLTNSGFKPDMVVIDYFECLKPERDRFSIKESEWTEEAKMMRRLENLAKKLDVALWVPVQGNKESITSALVTMDKAGGSIKKVQIAQVIISISRTLEDAENNRATLALLKNRSGKANIALENIMFNNGTSTIECDEVMGLNNRVVIEEAVARQKADETLNIGRQKMQELKAEREGPATPPPPSLPNLPEITEMQVNTTFDM